MTASEQAQEVGLASYMFDDLGLFTVLLNRIIDGSRFALNLHLDSETFHGPVPHNQHSRVSRLQRKGANVYLCKGLGRLPCEGVGR